jgi:hypothetical protein
MGGLHFARGTGGAGGNGDALKTEGDDRSFGFHAFDRE